MRYVTDTHSLIWHMTGDPRLSKKAGQVFRKADIAEESIVIPCIVFFELTYLVEKKKIDVDFDNFVDSIRLSPNYQVEPLCIPIIQRSRTSPMMTIRDPWDRLIAATADHLSLPLITRDRFLGKIGLNVVW